MRPTADSPGSVDTLTLASVSKAFGGRRALYKITISLQRGRIQGLVGSNGAGKSTLAWLLSGRFHDYSGDVFESGCPVTVKSRRDAQRLGVALVPQEPALVSDLSISENIALGAGLEVRPGIAVGRREREAWTSTWCSLFDVSIDQSRPIRDLSLAQRQAISLIAAAARRPRYLVIDEPTASIAEEPILPMERFVRVMRSANTCLLVISHRLEVVLSVCDHVTAIRDGSVVDARDSPCWTLPELQNAIADVPRWTVRSSSPTSVDPSVGAGELFLLRPDRCAEATHAIQTGRVTAVRLANGESASPILRSIIGIPTHGHAGSSIVIRGQARTWSSPLSAAADSVLYLSCDREEEGGFPQLTVRDNLLIGGLGRISTLGLAPSWRRMRRATTLAHQFGIDAQRLSEPLFQLSGGNQQRVLVGRIANAEPTIMLLDEPNRGVDAASLPALAAAVRSLSCAGRVVLLASTDSAFLVAASDAVLDIEL